MATHYDDWHVWVVVEALRRRTTAPRSHLQAAHQSTAGVFVDLAMGTFSTALIAAALAFSRGESADGEIFDRSFVLSVAGDGGVSGGDGGVGDRAASTGGGRGGAGAGNAGGARRRVVSADVRGDDAGRSGWRRRAAARRVMLAVNGVVVAVGVLNAASWIWLGRETAWLPGVFAGPAEGDGSGGG